MLKRGIVRGDREAPARDDEQQIDELIRGAGRMQLVTHVDPDGDAIGSLLGLGWLLAALGKDLALTCESPVPEIYRWLPGSDQVTTRAAGACDLVVCLDCSDARRMGRVFDDSLNLPPIINIDHHITNTMFGAVNHVDPSCAATAQMVLNLADPMGLEVTHAAAVCLLTGLVTDTRSFRTANVDTSAFRAALRLMEAGASLSEVSRRVLDNHSLATMRMWGEAINQMQCDDGILWATVSRDMRKRWMLDDDESSGLANFLTGVREAQVVVVFTERAGGTIDVGMRAAPGCDVAQVALQLGGGGHPQASGCTLEGMLSDIKERVLAQLRQSLSMQRVSGGCAGARSAAG